MARSTKRKATVNSSVKLTKKSMMKKTKINTTKVAIIMGSQSDAPKMTAAWDTLTELGITYEKKVVSAHRTP